MNSTAHTHTAAPRLERPRNGRMISGVSAGIARHLNIDPVLVRIAFVVATLAGGAGILAYVAALLVVPDEGSEAPLLRETSARRAGVIAGVALLVIGGIAALESIFDGDVFDGLFWPIAMAGAGAFLVLRSPGDTAPVSHDATTAVHATAERPASAPRRSRRATRVVFGSMLLAAGAIGTLSAAGVDLGWQEATGLAIAAAGASLVAGSFFGASPWLALLPLAVAASVGSLGAAGVAFDGPIGERSFDPVRASEIPREYRLAVGALNVDLRGIELPAGSTTTVKVRVGIGEAHVELPDDVAVRVTGHAGLGEITLPGGRSDGGDVDRSESFAAPGRPTIVLDAEVGVGELRVEREGR